MLYFKFHFMHNLLAWDFQTGSPFERTNLFREFATFGCRCGEMMRDKDSINLSPINFNSRIPSLIIPLLQLLLISRHNYLFVIYSFIGPYKFPFFSFLSFLWSYYKSSTTLSPHLLVLMLMLSGVVFMVKCFTIAIYSDSW